MRFLAQKQREPIIIVRALSAVIWLFSEQSIKEIGNEADRIKKKEPNLCTTDAVETYHMQRERVESTFFLIFPNQYSCLNKRRTQTTTSKKQFEN